MAAAVAPSSQHGSCILHTHRTSATACMLRDRHCTLHTARTALQPPHSKDGAAASPQRGWRCTLPTARMALHTPHCEDGVTPSRPFSVRRPSAQKRSRHCGTFRFDGKRPAHRKLDSGTVSVLALSIRENVNFIPQPARFTLDAATRLRLSRCDGFLAADLSSIASQAGYV